MSIVYRIENPDGTGPYRGSNSKVKYITSDVCPISHPGPRNDELFHEAVDRICEKKDYWNRDTGWDDLLCDKEFGFASKEQLRSWFDTQMLISISEAGAVIAEYHVKKSDIVFGEKQVVFVREKKQKKQYDIIEYFKLREMKIENIRETEEPEPNPEQAADWGYAIAA